MTSKKIKIGIDGGDFTPGSVISSGIQRIVDSFLKEVKRIANQYQINYYYFGKDSSSSYRRIIKKLPQKFFASLFLPFNLIKDKNDVFLGFSGYLPLMINLLKMKKIVFLYDLGFFKFPQFYSNPRKLIKSTVSVLNNADKVIVLSNYTQREIINKFPQIDRKKFIRIYPGINHLLKEPSNSINQLIKSDFFLYVGVVKPIKNIEKLLEYFYYFLQLSEEKNYQLILIGKKEEQYFERLLQNTYYKRLKRKVRFLDNVSDNELINYYLNARALLNFSHEEGFCFPVLEALLAGGKAIVNNLPLYQEFKPYFNNLFIGKDKKEIIQLMIKASRERKNIKPIIHSPFIWANFSQKLLSSLLIK